ncbi:DUF2987 domain-containing protein [Pseudoalteromonas sp. MM17-2]|uniref:DUF2987 domain-containing protein n=1 Tax=Pseudoalteromonas sp. MM17-2 TaxID=2917753 RepID=UPI001EF6F06A|nr:DUF2987 domain-containing protein [Pseudoalteromonas sp. MM17-2]MCG7544419.1 DUF2987 domain-containing protein [Pseudoalteromonas sp. MM17-2]
MNKCLFIATLMCSMAVNAQPTDEPVVMSYDGFFDRMEVVNEGNFQHAKVGFYLKTYENAENCVLKEGKIVTERERFPLTYDDNGQLFLPFDKQLDTHKAMVIATPQSGQCQLSMQIEALGPFTRLTYAQAYTIEQEFDDLIGDLSGFFVGTLMPFLLPEHKGVQLHFADTLPAKVPDSWQCQGLQCKVSIEQQWQDNNNTLVEGTQIHRITPWIAQ